MCRIAAVGSSRAARTAGYSDTATLARNRPTPGPDEVPGDQPRIDDAGQPGDGAVVAVEARQVQADVAEQRDDRRADRVAEDRRDEHQHDGLVDHHAHDRVGRRAQRHHHAELARALGHRHEHGVHHRQRDDEEEDRDDDRTDGAHQAQHVRHPRQQARPGRCDQPVLLQQGCQPGGDAVDLGTVSQAQVDRRDTLDRGRACAATPAA
jgi:hypothetical protein